MKLLSWGTIELFLLWEHWLSFGNFRQELSCQDAEKRWSYCVGREKKLIIDGSKAIAEQHKQMFKHYPHYVSYTFDKRWNEIEYIRIATKMSA